MSVILIYIPVMTMQPVWIPKEASSAHATMVIREMASHVVSTLHVYKHCSAYLMLQYDYVSTII